MDIFEIFRYRFPVSGVETYIFVPPLVMGIISFFTSMGGVSGAFILLPFQMSVLHYTAPGVSATNFVYNIVSIPSGVYRYIRDGKFSRLLFLTLMIGTLPGVFLGYFIRLTYLPNPGPFKIFVGCVLAYLGLRTLWSGYSDVTASKKGGSSLPPPKGRITAEKFGRVCVVSFEGRPYSFSPLFVASVSLVVGVIGGAYGIGGGALMAPFLVSVMRLPVYIVSGAALCSTWVTSIVAALFYAFGPLTTKSANASPDWLLGALFGLGGFIGIYTGARLQKYFPASYIKLILGFAILGVSARYLWPVVERVIG
ncbi:sulfite exporter TauE/SafE family protein [Thermodesulforhabdus norvegica]|uniref:Probable membrane transporter protein n=1 Tax=Thermodesulforhabdus norvegica TaxID=39841 RepID=A0A1I4R8Y0_9BACT|nr:sulfite exporter TauE/SafE family protein [Thermodesulforhabdus norvegica]SFM48762.1 hypothetical protein SAMN05660836_00480 [Thermodesulforhabdus norvegica]